MPQDKEIFDLIIIGAGPAGLGASIYASRYKLSHIVIGDEIGGQVVEAAEIENWAGEVSIPGKTLMEKFQHHAHHLGAKIIQADTSAITKNGEVFTVKTNNNEEYQSKSVILALGMKARKMNVPGEDKFVGKGVSYCATCDAMFFREKDVVVVGGGDAAATAAIHLTEFAKSVKILYREKTNWEPSWEEQLDKLNVERIACTNIKEIKGPARNASLASASERSDAGGSDKVNAISYETSQGVKDLEVQGIFIEVGTTPGVAIAQNLGVNLDEQSYIIVDGTQATNIENVYAAGDVTTGSNKFRQIITAVAEGAVAAGSVYKKLKIPGKDQGLKAKD